MSFEAGPLAQRASVGLRDGYDFCCCRAAHVARPVVAKLFLFCDTGVRDVLVAVATHADVGLFAMPGEPFEGTQA